MKSSILFIGASALLESVVAGGHHVHQAMHQQLKEIREIPIEAANNATCSICTTYYTTFYGEATLIQPAEMGATSLPVHTASQPALSIPTATPSPQSSSSPSSSSSISVSPSNSNSASQPSESSIKSTNPLPGSSGPQWCMTYSPYNADGTCKSTSSVASDVASIASKGFKSIRLYSTDCTGLENVGAVASSHGLKLVLGVYISNTGIGAASAQVSAITSWAAGNWASVEMIVVGNEAIFNKFCSASDLATFIASAKVSFVKAGYTGPVTTTEPLSVITTNAATLCPVMDLAASNIHPFFNAEISASDAGAFVAQQLQLLGQVCPGKEAYNLETGWPSQGEVNGNAVPGKEEQKAAVESIVKEAGGRSAVFSFVDDEWKEPGQFGVERSWGCSDLFEGKKSEKQK